MCIFSFLIHYGKRWWSKCKRKKNENIIEICLQHFKKLIRDPITFFEIFKLNGREQKFIAESNCLFFPLKFKLEKLMSTSTVL